MLYKFFLSVALAGALAFSGMALARACPLVPPPSPSQQTNKATKSTSGTVASIGDTGTTFSLKVNDSNGEHVMNFVLDKNAHVEGQVKVGTKVVVEYTLAENGQNVAVTVTAQA